MAKALDYRWDLPYAPGAMFEQGLTRDYVEAQAKAVGHHDLTIAELEDGSQGGRAVEKYTIDADLPAWAAKMFPARASLTETRLWGPPEDDGSRSYSFLVTIDQVPVEIKGLVVLQASPDGTTQNTVHADIKAKIPIVGSKIEELVAQELGKTIEGERDFMLSWMGTHA